MPSLRAVVSRAAFACAAILATTVACAEVVGPEDSAAAIEVVSGNNQAARVGGRLDQSVVVRVTDRRGNGVGKASVVFRPDSVSGTAEPAIAVTDSTGTARVSWRLGSRLGAMRLEVSYADIAPITVTATTVADRMSIESGDLQSARLSVALANPLIVKVTDFLGRVLQGVPVTFTPDSGTGATSPAVISTDASGLARTTWTLAGASGSKRLVASITTGSPVSFSAVANQDVMTVAAGDQQGARAGTVLPRQVQVRVADQNGAVIPNVSVTFTPDAASGSASPASALTNAQGIATTTWTLGSTIGAQRLVARTNVSAPITVTARGLDPSELLIVSGNQQVARAGTPVPAPLVVVVTDAAGTRVPGAAVTFTPDAGSGSVSTAMVTTDTLGRAMATWTLGGVVGGMRLRAISGADTVVFAATTNADRIVVSKGQGQSARFGTALAEPIEAIVKDINDQPVPNVVVTFAPAAGSGAVSPTTVATDASGAARTLWTLGGAPGTAQLLVSAPTAVQSVAVTATATGDVVSVVSGGNQSAQAGAALAAPVVVQLLGTSGTPVSGAAVTFTAATGSGTVTTATVNTDANGRAQTAWTLGASAGPMTLRVTTASALPLTVSATALAAAAVTVTGGAGQSARVGAALPAPVAVTVRDLNGNPVPGLTVTFTPAAGSGTVSPATAATNVNGVATTTWTLGATAGAVSLTVSATGVTSVTVNATAIAANADRIIVSKGQGQSARFGTALAEPIEAIVKDIYDQPVPNVVVTFTPAVGSGAVSPTTVATDASGAARTLWTLGGAPGTAQLIVSAPTAVQSVTVNATATGDSLEVEAGDAQRALVATALPTPVRVRLTSGGTPLRNVLVTFTPTTGSGTVAQDTVRTDFFGRAQTTWTLGAARGPMSIQVSTSVTPPRTVVATALSADAISLLTAGPLSGFVGTAIDSTLRVRVNDRDGAVVPGATVSFAPSAGAVSAATATTNASGEASVRWTLGITPGAQVLTAAVGTVPVATINAIARVDSSRVLTIQSGDAQDTTVTTPLAAPLVARVADRFGNPVQGASITWSAINGVTLASSSSTTNASGDASVSVTTGRTLGAATVTAQLSGLTASVTFSLATQANFTSVWAGNYFTCGLAERGESYCWGFNQNKQLGSLDTASYTNAPRLPLTAGSVIPTFRKIDGGENHGCGITVARQLMCWGLGQGSFGTTTPAVVNIGNASVIEDVSVGSGHSCALTAAGVAVCVGDNQRGQLGIGSVNANAVPFAAVDSLYSKVASGGLHSCGFVRGSGRLMCWGDNQQGQLGDGSTVLLRNVATPVAGGVSWDTTSVVLGASHGCALNTAGAAICWGSNAYGQLGTGSAGAFSSDTALVGGGLTFVRLIAGRDHTCGVTAGNVAHCWGRNDAGQLGDGTRTNRGVPTAVSGGLRFASLAAGEFHSCGVALNASGSQGTLASSDLIFCWGDSEYGQAGTGTFRPNNSPVLTPTRVSHQP